MSRALPVAQALAGVHGTPTIHDALSAIQLQYTNLFLALFLPFTVPRSPFPASLVKREPSSLAHSNPTTSITSAEYLPTGTSDRPSVFPYSTLRTLFYIIRDGPNASARTNDRKGTRGKRGRIDENRNERKRRKRRGEERAGHRTSNTEHRTSKFRLSDVSEVQYFIAGSTVRGIGVLG